MAGATWLAGPRRGLGAGAQRQLPAGSITHLPPQAHIPLTAQGTEICGSPKDFGAPFPGRNRYITGGSALPGETFTLQEKTGSLGGLQTLSSLFEKA